MPIGQAKFGLLGGIADLGKLELIETQTFTAQSSVIFNDMKENIYDVHFFVWSGLRRVTSSSSVVCRFSKDNGSSFISSGYQVAMQYGGNTGGFGELRSTSTNSITYLSYSNTTTSNANQNGYLYLYNLGNSSKYSFLTNQSFSQSTSTIAFFYFGGGVLPTAETHNAVQLLLSGGATISGTFKLYGVKQL